MIMLKDNEDYRSKPSETLSQDIAQYYKECHWLYRSVWFDNNLALHYGYWDAHTKTHSESLIGMNRVLSERGNMPKQAKVLDAGCGIGGSSIWLAENYQARVTGITLSDLQVKVATKQAAKRKVSHLVDFQVANYCHTPFPDESFDVIWALESVCHSGDKKAFVQEAHRLLKPNGYFMLADGYAKKHEFNGVEWQKMQTWLDGWELPNLTTETYLTGHLQESGFKEIQFIDISENVFPSAIRMRNIATFAQIPEKIVTLLGLRTPAQTKNYNNALSQHDLYKENLLG